MDITVSNKNSNLINRLTAGAATLHFYMRIKYHDNGFFLKFFNKYSKNTLQTIILFVRVFDESKGFLYNGLK